MEQNVIRENKLAESVLGFLRRLLPASLLDLFRSPYHFLIALLAVLIYRFPSRNLTVIGVTGTKGKSTVVEVLGAILRKAGKPIATLSSLNYWIGDKSWPNTLKMTVPGRFKLQGFIRKAADSGAKYLVLEMTSEAIKQHRHRFIKFDIAALVNLQPEHIESHGSFEAYRSSKAKLFQVAKKAHVLNADDESFDFFNKIIGAKKILYSVKNVSNLSFSKTGSDFELEDKNFHTNLIGRFNVSNVLCAISVARALDVPWEVIQEAVREFPRPAGRLEFIEEGQLFNVVVDFAHTPDSLKAVYETLQELSPAGNLICVLGATGGGRDKWKRPVMGEVASRYCDEIILTDEDPYDENPQEIIDAVESGVLQARNSKSEIRNVSHQKILDRREAIEKAVSLAKPGDTVVITGKGGEQWMVLLGGRKVPWNDSEIAREAIKKHGTKTF